MRDAQATYARFGPHGGLWYHRLCRNRPWPSDADIEMNVSGSVAADGVNGDGNTGSTGSGENSQELRGDDASAPDLRTAPAVRH
jgi:hypothetical protein